MNAFGSTLLLTAAAVLPVFTGCGGEAILEVDLTFPGLSTSTTTGELFAVTQIGTSAEFQSSITSEDPLGISLEERSSRDRISVVSSEVRDVSMRIRICSRSDCSGPLDDGAPQLLYVLEAPFFIGEVTFFEHDVECLPGFGCVNAAPTTRFDRCAIRGCTTVPEGYRGRYCRSDGTHFCE